LAWQRAPGSARTCSRRRYNYYTLFQTWLPRLVTGCREALTLLLPFSEGEKSFLERLLEQGEVQPLLLTQDETLAQRIVQQPMLHWKAHHVQKHRK